MPAIEFDGVWKKFRRGEQHDSLRDLIPSMVKGVLGRSRKADLDKNDFWVLRDVSFNVEPGEALGIIGQNGAGKSTTLKLLTKILKPTRGSCHVRGRVGALIEIAAGFHPDLTGRENVFLQGAIMGMRREEIRRHFDEIVEFAAVGRVHRHAGEALLKRDERTARLLGRRTPRIRRCCSLTKCWRSATSASSRSATSV